MKPVKLPKVVNLSVNPPDAEDYRVLLLYPVRTREETKRYLRSTDGFESITREVIKTWRGVEKAVAFPGLSRHDLIVAFDAREILLHIERKLEPFYRRAADNRREAESRTMRVLLTLNRAVKATRDKELMARFKPLSDWIASHRGGRKPKPADGAAVERTTTRKRVSVSAAVDV